MADKSNIALMSAIDIATNNVEKIVANDLKYQKCAGKYCNKYTCLLVTKHLDKTEQTFRMAGKKKNKSQLLGYRQ